jgi:hypothetical protein
MSIDLTVRRYLSVLGVFEKINVVECMKFCQIDWGVLSMILLPTSLFVKIKSIKSLLS